MTIVAAIILVVFTGILSVVVCNRVQEDLFHPLVLVGFIFLYYILAPGGYLLITGAFKWPRVHPDPIGDLTVALLVTLVTYILMLLAYRWVSLDRLIPAVEELDLPDQRISESDGLVWLGLLGFAAGVVFYLYYVLVNGGFVDLITAVPRNSFQTVPNTGRYRLLATAGLFAGLITTCTGLRQYVERDELSQEGYLLIGILSIVTLSIAVSLRSRMNIVVPAAYLLLYFYTSNRVSTRTIIGGAGVVVAFGGGFTFLEHVLIGGASLDVLIRGFIDPTRLELFTVAVQAVPAEQSYQYGQTILRALPVSWSGMPVRYGDQLEVIVIGRNRKYITFPAMMLGELWLNFGPIGLFAGGALFGGALSMIYILHQRMSGHLAGGLYPLALLTVLSALPTSIEWATKSMLFRLCIPVVLAIGIVYGYERVTETARPNLRT